MSRTVLWISAEAPYDSILHASGQIENFYTKKLNADRRFKLSLISFCDPQMYEIVAKDLKTYGIEHELTSIYMCLTEIL